ncbi:MAG: enoyl-CoA hydratase/isomerase family protein [Bacteroidetes bacterium]|nr:enoyl-CoA hydratase/isomerase family protein [Bacteroidota bacterium]
MPSLLIQEQGPVLTLTLNRPEKRNALNPDLTNMLRDALEVGMNRGDIRVIIINSSGDAFCAGADLAYLQQIRNNSFEENVQDSMNLKALFELIIKGPKPVIAAVRGAALAGGCGLANACDICFATPAAQFGYTESKIGFIPALVSIFLQRKINGSIARELLISGRIFKSEEAKLHGIVHHIVEEETLDKHVMEFARHLAGSTSGQSIALTKELLWNSSALGLDEGMNLAASMNARARASEDCIKGIDAFLNKEKISWS